MWLEIRGHHLPGRSWENHPNVHVGIQLGREPASLVAGDETSATWSTEIRVHDRGDDLDFAGPAVQGRPGDRFVYLSWGNVADDGSFTMFRRAKLMLADVVSALPSLNGDSLVVATVDLTDERGGPRCARLRPPALSLAPS
ncbi:MAG TPA: DUF5990 family protein [Pseudonocardia sp.]|jgi:hypothetical protein|nr:DUF5990 family protein [Pseudonocardia sp.]